MEVSEIDLADTYEKIYGNKCRICLRQAVEICELFQNGDAIPHKLMAVASVQIKEGDGLPPVICLPCNQRLDSSYDFICQIQNSDDKLRQLLQFKSSSDDSVNSEIIVKTIIADTISSVISSQKENSERQEVNSTNFYPDEKQHIENVNVSNNLLEDSVRQIHSVEHEVLPVFDEDAKHNKVIGSVKHINSIKEEKLNVEQCKDNFHSSENNVEISDNLQILEETSKINDTQDYESFRSKVALQLYTSLLKVKHHVAICNETHEGRHRKGHTSLKEQTNSKFTCTVCLKEFICPESFITHTGNHSEYRNSCLCPLKERFIQTIEEEKSIKAEENVCDTNCCSNHFDFTKNETPVCSNSETNLCCNERESQSELNNAEQKKQIKQEEFLLFDEHVEHNEVLDSVGYISSIKEEELSLLHEYVEQKESTLFGSDVNNIEALDNSQVLEETSKTNGTQDDEDKPLISRITKFRCTQCMKFFCSKKLLQRHASVHTRRTKLQYICYVCDKHYSTLTKMENHVAMCHETDCEEENSKDKRVSYDQDKGATSIKDKRISNVFDNIFLKDRQTGSKYTCKICLNEFTHQNFFLKHAKSHAEYKEDLDNFYLCSLNERSAETIRDGKENSLQCTQCEKQFTTKRNLRRHLFIHTGIKYTCRICGKGFSRVDKLKDHEIIHHMAEIFDSSESDDSDDMDSINRGGCVEEEKKDRCNRPHKCANCPKSFARAQSLVNHLERHVRANQITKKYLCEVCSKCFAHNASLTIHMRTHTGVKPYACSMCSRAFPKSSSLQRHLRTHSGEKPYICQYCSRAFARANTLARHITTHTGETKYHCEVCTKSFKRLASLNQHINIHTGQRPHVCKLCTRTFHNTGSLYIHKKKCKGEQPCNTEVTVSMENSVMQHDVNVPRVFIYSRKNLVEDTIVGQVMPTPQYMIANVHNQDLLIS